MPAHICREVFTRRKYRLLAGGVAALVFAFATMLSNIHLLFSFIFDPSVPPADKFLLPWHLLGSITTNFSALSAASTVAIALLVGVNVALVTYRIRQRNRQYTEAGVTVGALGVASGILGIGCAACGSLILTALTGAVGGAWLVAALPLHGVEFGLLGVALLVASTAILCKRMSESSTCPVA